MIISSDEWNRRDVKEVIGLVIFSGWGGDKHSASEYASLIASAGSEWTVHADKLMRVPVSSLRLPTADITRLDEKAMADIGLILDRILAWRPVPDVGPRPVRHPYPGQVEFADLAIADDGAKPVVVISSEAYAAETGYAQVVVCRMTSNPGYPHDLDVVLRSQPGKVVCSDIYTISTRRLRGRTTRSVSLTVRERELVMSKVRRMLGLN